MRHSWTQLVSGAHRPGGVLKHTGASRFKKQTVRTLEFILKWPGSRSWTGEWLQGPQSLKQRLGPGPNAFRAAVRRGRIPWWPLSDQRRLSEAFPCVTDWPDELQQHATPAHWVTDVTAAGPGSPRVFPTPRAPAAPDSAPAPRVCSGSHAPPRPWAASSRCIWIPSGWISSRVYQEPLLHSGLLLKPTRTFKVD